MFNHSSLSDAILAPFTTAEQFNRVRMYKAGHDGLRTHDHNCLLARLAPSTSAPSLSHDTSGSILP